MTLLILLKLLAILILLLLSAISSGSETALTAVSKLQAHRQNEKGIKNSNFILKIKELKDEFITGMVLANNVFNILATALMTELLVSSLLGVTVATIFMTIMIVIFSEVTPKIFAINRPMLYALKVARFFYIYTKLIKPIVKLINYISEKIIKKLGLSLETDQSKIIKEEFEGAVQLQRQLSKKGDNEAEYMSNLLELKNLKVDELMTHRNEILYLDIEDNFKNNLKAINNSTFTRIPLIKNNFNNLIGVIDIRELLKDPSFNENGDNNYLEKNSFQPVFIPQNKLLIKQLIDFKSQREHMALVVDEYGEIQGLITLEDIIEEIIGEIFDETDTDESYLEKIDDHNFLFNGNASIREINRSLGIELPDQFVTLSGLIHDIAKEIPKVGKIVTYKEFKLQIISRSINKINKVKLIL